jgi:hypothetical protein
MFEVPAYVIQSGAADAPLKHGWNNDDWPTFYTERDRLQPMLAKTTTAGAVAVALGCLEWVTWRMSPHAETAIVMQAIEAMWAGLIDRRYTRSLYSSPLALLRQDWLGPSRAPVYEVYWQMVAIQSPLQMNQPTSPEASCAIRLGRFVMPTKDPFETWWRTVLQRLVETHPSSEEGPNDIGLPIPRIALDPTITYTPQDDHQHLTAFLATLDPSSNPFLASPEEMIEAGFDGTPYQLGSA